MPKRKRDVAAPAEGEGALPFQEQEVRGDGVYVCCVGGCGGVGVGMVVPRRPIPQSIDGPSTRPPHHRPSINSINTKQLTFKMSLLPHAMEDLGAHVQSKLNGLLMKCVYIHNAT